MELVARRPCNVEQNQGEGGHQLVEGTNMRGFSPAVMLERVRPPAICPFTLADCGLIIKRSATGGAHVLRSSSASKIPTTGHSGLPEPGPHGACRCNFLTGTITAEMFPVKTARHNGAVKRFVATDSCDGGGVAEQGTGQSVAP